MDDLIIKVTVSNNIIKRILCYPLSECGKVLQERIHYLKKIGVTHIISGGPVSIGEGIKVLGKGFSSIVIKAIWKNQIVLMKVRRLDSRRETLEHEAQYLSLANKINVGPKLYVYSKDFIIREYIDGIEFQDWIRREENNAIIKLVLRDIILQCYRLDVIGLDHGELSRPHKHIIISIKHDLPKAFIIDFESASTQRKPHNVTSFLNYILFRKNEISAKVRRILRLNDNDISKVHSLIREYKKRPNFILLENILKNTHLADA